MLNEPPRHDALALRPRRWPVHDQAPRVPGLAGMQLPQNGIGASEVAGEWVLDSQRPWMGGTPRWEVAAPQAGLTTGRFKKMSNVPMNRSEKDCRFGSFGASELVLASSGDHPPGRAPDHSCRGWGHDRSGERVPS